MKAFTLIAVLLSTSALAQESVKFLRIEVSTTYKCYDSDGVLHFFNKQPKADSGMKGCEVKKTEYPIFEIPGRSPIYRCVDSDGTVHFSSQKVAGSECKEVVQIKSDWTHLGTYSNGVVLSVKKHNLGGPESAAPNSVWYKMEYPETDTIYKSQLYLVSIKCSSSQIKELQSVANYRDGRVLSYGAGQTRYAVPDTSDEAVVRYACPKK